MPTWSAANDYWIGFHSYSGGSWPFEGLIDEVRISDVARLPGWIQTEYNNQYNPGAFHGSPGSEESTFTWNGSAGDNNWATASNWDVNAVPGAGHTVVIPNERRDLNLKQ